MAEIERVELLTGAPVLVVDDDSMVRFIVRAVLETAGMRVTEAEDGAQALALVNAGEPYSLMLLDLDMPNVNGQEVLETVRRTRNSAELPVIVLTGADSVDDERRALAAGADGFARKPIVAQRLLDQLRATVATVPR